MSIPIVTPEEYKRRKEQLDTLIVEARQKFVDSGSEALDIWEARQQVDELVNQRNSLENQWANEQALANAELTGINPGVRALITFVKGGYTNGFSSLDTDYQYPYQQRWVENVLAMVAGLQTEPGNGNNISVSHRRFEEPARVVNLPPSGSDGLQGRTYGTYEQSNYYTYPHWPCLAIPMRNTTINDIPVDAKIFGGASGNYASISMSVITPNKTNAERSAIDGWTWSLVGTQYTGNGTTTRTGSFVVPADTTVIFFGQSSARRMYQDTSNNHYQFEWELRIDEVEKLFPLGIETDVLAIEAIQSRKITRFAEIWTYTGDTEPDESEADQDGNE